MVGAGSKCERRGGAAAHCAAPARHQKALLLAHTPARGERLAVGACGCAQSEAAARVDISMLSPPQRDARERDVSQYVLVPLAWELRLMDSLHVSKGIWQS